MRSYVACTEQIDDIDLAAQELLEGVKGTKKKHGVGILFCYSDMESAQLSAKLSEMAGFDIIGCTCIASMDHEKGFHSMAATLTLLTSDDIPFAVAASGPITPENVAEQVKDTYARAKDQLGETPKLLFALPPYLLQIMLDAYSNAFNAAAPGVPVVGGLPSYNATGDENLTFLHGKASGDRLVLLAVGGNIHPVFSVQNVTSLDVNRKRKVTKAKDNIVYEVGDGQRFTDYLKDVGLSVESLAHGNNTVTFVSNPLLIESSEEDFAFARTLHEIDLKKGSGTAIGEIPSGATLSICALHREDIAQAASAGIRDLKAKIDASARDGYAYSTVLAISCIGRHLLMLPENDAEVKRILAEFPKGLTLSGFYSYGELGPQGASRSRNFAHNESLVLCAV